MRRGTRAFDPTRPDNGKRWTPAELEELYNLRQTKSEVPWEAFHREHYQSRTLTAVVQAYKKISNQKSAEHKNTKRQQKLESAKAIAPKERELEQTPKELSTMTPPRYGILDPHRGDVPQDSEDSDKVGPEEVLYDIMPNGEYVVSPRRKQSAVGSTGIRNEVRQDNSRPSKILKLRHKAITSNENVSCPSPSYPQTAAVPVGSAQLLEQTTDTEKPQPYNNNLDFHDSYLPGIIEHYKRIKAGLIAAAKQKAEEEVRVEVAAKLKQLEESNYHLMERINEQANEIKQDKTDNMEISRKYENLLREHSEMIEKLGNLFQKDTEREEIAKEHFSKILSIPGASGLIDLPEFLKIILDCFHGRQDARKDILGIRDSVELASTPASSAPNK